MLSLLWPKFNPWSGNWDPTSLTEQPKLKKKKKKFHNVHFVWRAFNTCVGISVGQFPKSGSVQTKVLNILYFKYCQICLQENINKREDRVLSVINHLLKKQEQKRYNHVEKLYIFPQGKADHIFNKSWGHSYKPFFILPNTRGPVLLTKLSPFLALHIPLAYVKPVF